MKSSREYEIAWQGLKLGVHEYTYELQDDFLQRFETHMHDNLSKLNAVIKLTFEKNNGFFQLKFDVGGSVNTACDRCGDEMTLQLWDEFKLLVKLVEEEEAEPEEAEDDIAFIPRHETVIDMSKWLYEYLMLSIPLHRVHQNRPDGSSACNPEALKLLQQLSEQADDAPKDIWKGLEKLKENKK